MTKEVYKFGESCEPSVFNETCTIPCKVDNQPAQILCTFNKYQKVAGIQSWMQWFNLFALYWGMNFVTSFGEMVLAGVFAKWYWTRDKSQLACCVPLFNSIFNATVYHLGTIAFGSLIIAIIKVITYVITRILCTAKLKYIQASHLYVVEFQIIRAVVSYVESKIKKMNNDLTRCLLCACKCCLWCLEKFMMFINRNAYIVCAVRSTNFLSSGK